MRSALLWSPFRIASDRDEGVFPFVGPALLHSMAPPRRAFADCAADLLPLLKPAAKVRAQGEGGLTYV
jgi:hypothetical protein